MDALFASGGGFPCKPEILNLRRRRERLALLS
jgi:hypothetical protein